MIYWNVLLGSEDVCQTLQALYDDLGGINPLASHLGLSPVTVLKKLKECKVKMRKRGGSHQRFQRIAFPDKWWNMSTEQLVKITGYSPNYVRRLRKEKLCQLEQSIKTKDQASSSSTPQATLPSVESEKESSK